MVENIWVLKELLLLIDEKGIIRKIYPKVKVKGHVEEVSKDLKEI